MNFLARSILLTRAIAAVPPKSRTHTLTAIRWGSTTKKLGNKRTNFKTLESIPSTVDPNVPIEAFAASMNTTIPPEKQAHVDAMKKKISGGALSVRVRSLYRDVPTPLEIDKLNIPGNFIPKIASNARELIDFALMHIPEQGGPRRSKHKKRMAQKWERKRVADAVRKKNAVANHEAKHKKLRKRNLLIQKYKREALRLYGPKPAVATAATPVAGTTGAKVAKQSQ
jgi:hypothetical protein